MFNPAKQAGDGVPAQKLAAVTYREIREERDTRPEQSGFRIPGTFTSGCCVLARILKNSNCTDHKRGVDALALREPWISRSTGTANSRGRT